MASLFDANAEFATALTVWFAVHYIVSWGAPHWLAMAVGGHAARGNTALARRETGGNAVGFLHALLSTSLVLTAWWHGDFNELSSDAHASTPRTRALAAWSTAYFVWDLAATLRSPVSLFTVHAAMGLAGALAMGGCGHGGNVGFSGPPFAHIAMQSLVMEASTPVFVLSSALVGMSRARSGDGEFYCLPQTRAVAARAATGCRVLFAALFLGVRGLLVPYLAVSTWLPILRASWALDETRGAVLLACLGCSTLLNVVWSLSIVGALARALARVNKND